MRDVNLGKRSLGRGHYKVIVFDNDLHEIIGEVIINDAQIVDDITTMILGNDESELLVFDSFEDLKEHFINLLK